LRESKWPENLREKVILASKGRSGAHKWTRQSGTGKAQKYCKGGKVNCEGVIFHRGKRGESFLRNPLLGGKGNIESIQREI